MPVGYRGCRRGSISAWLQTGLESDQGSGVVRLGRRGYRDAIRERARSWAGARRYRSDADRAGDWRDVGEARHCCYRAAAIHSK